MKKARRWIFALAVLSMSGCGYNRIQALDEQTNQQKGNIQTELMRRNDLIPNLVATVDEVAKFERGTFTDVARARAGLDQARQQLSTAVKGNAATEDISKANAAVTDNLRMFLNVSVEAYPQLKANQNFIALQDELTETENRIAVARRDYNESVQQYNTYIRSFPQALTAKVIGAKRKEPFAAPASAEQAPRVQFGGSAPKPQ
ncbi:MAG TPA: LemA family protein [Longimicrobiales bacterium]